MRDALQLRRGLPSIASLVSPAIATGAAAALSSSQAGPLGRDRHLLLKHFSEVVPLLLLRLL